MTALRILASLGALLLTLAVAAPSWVQAQAPARVARVGVLLFSTPAADPNVPIFREAIRALGWVEGKNLAIEYRYAESKVERLPDLARELARLKPDLIYALGGDVAPFARNATQTIPIVMVVSNDPVEAGMVSSLGRPGGNVTGLTFLLSELAAKRLELLKEIAPKVARVALLWNPDHADPDFPETQAAARQLGVRLQSLEVRRPGDFDAAFDAALRNRAEAMIVVGSRLTLLNQQKIIEFSARHRLPLVAGWGSFAERGALLTYGPNIDDIVRRSASHVDRILKGARPSDLPVEQPTTFQLLINLKTAQALGLTIPPSLTFRADRVIQ